MGSDSQQKRSPLRALWYDVRYAFDRTFKTGGRRYEFEHKYGRHGDYFGYLEKPYELEKYARTLAIAKAHRRNAGSALEIGCSVGVFTRMIASEFDAVTASDIAAEALVLAEKTVGGEGRVAYLHGDLLSLTLPAPVDVVFCAEILMYVREADGPAVCAVLDRLMTPDAILIEVTQADRSPSPKFFHGWDAILGKHFPIVHRERFEDPTRPYEIVVYAKRD